MRKVANIMYQVTGALLFLPLLLTGCIPQSSQQTSQVQQEKAINTTLTGTITKSGGKFYISEIGKATKEIDSYTVKLDDYVGKKVSVTGQYSGITLFVDAIQ